MRQRSGAPLGLLSLLDVAMGQAQTILPTPATLTAGVLPGPTVRLTWTAPAGMWSFVVFRSADSAAGFTPLGPAIDARTYLDVSIGQGDRYFYIISAVSFGADNSVVLGSPGDTIGVTVAVPGLSPEGMIAGRVDDGLTGAPLPFVALRILPMSKGMMGPVGFVFTDMEGNYTARVDTGSYVICAQPGAHTGYASQWYHGADDSTKATPVHVSKDDSARADFELHLLSSSTQDRGIIAGTVFDDSTLTPLRDVTVRFVPQNSEANHDAFVSVLTDSLGRYRVSLDTTTYFVQAVPWIGAPMHPVVYLPEWFDKAESVSNAMPVHVADSMTFTADFRCIGLRRR